MERRSLSQVRGYRCLDCHWIVEASALPPRCARCRAPARRLQFMTKEEFLTALDSGQAGFCESCQIIHLR